MVLYLEALEKCEYWSSSLGQSVCRILKWRAVVADVLLLLDVTFTLGLRVRIALGDKQMDLTYMSARVFPSQKIRSYAICYLYIMYKKARYSYVRLAKGPFWVLRCRNRNKGSCLRPDLKRNKNKQEEIEMTCFSLGFNDLRIILWFKISYKNWTVFFQYVYVKVLCLEMVF